MIIALDEGLLDLAQYLLKKGHEVVSLYGYNRGVDAVVLKDTHLDEMPLSVQNFSGDNGIFVVSAKGLNPDEITRRIEQKSTDGLALF